MPAAGSADPGFASSSFLAASRSSRAFAASSEPVGSWDSASLQFLAPWAAPSWQLCSARDSSRAASISACSCKVNKSSSTKAFSSSSRPRFVCTALSVSAYMGVSLVVSSSFSNLDSSGFGWQDSTSLSRVLSLMCSFSASASASIADTAVIIYWLDPAAGWPALPLRTETKISAIGPRIC